MSITLARIARRRIVGSLVGTAALSITALLAATPAQADELDEQSCWMDVDTGAVQCFDASIDPVEYIEEATGENVLAVPSGESGLRGEAGTFDVFLLATVYDGTGFGGANMTYSTSNSAICGVTHSFSSLGSWNDRIESFQAFNGCSVVLYLDAGFGGSPIYGPFNASSDVGATFRNQASAIQIS